MEMLSPSDLVVQQAQEHLDLHNFPKEHAHKDTHTHIHAVRSTVCFLYFQSHIFPLTHLFGA